MTSRNTTEAMLSEWLICRSRLSSGSWSTVHSGRPSGVRVRSSTANTSVTQNAIWTAVCIAATIAAPIAAPGSPSMSALARPASTPTIAGMYVSSSRSSRHQVR